MFLVLITPTLYNSSAAQQSGLSLRGRGQGFPLTTKDVALSYFHRKIEEK